MAKPTLQSGSATDFSGGPNIRDAASELSKNECLDAWNVTFDERGGVSSRLGMVKYNGTAYGGDLIQNEFWSQILSTKIVNAGAKLYKGTSNTVNKTFTTTARATFTELGVYVIACHPVDGLFTSVDGVTWTAVADVDAPKGTCIATWQNKVWVGKPDGSVAWCAAGDPLTWSATDFNKLWEKDTQAIVALHIGSGQDILGRPGLIAYKLESAYRIHDSSTGAYETIDATNGAASAIAIIGVGPKVYSICKHGIFSYLEGTVGLKNESDRFAPLWDPAVGINLAQIDKWCAGRSGNRARFSLTRTGSTANDLALEFHTEQDWLAPGSNAMSCYSTSTGSADVTYGGSPTVVGQSYQLDSGGTDDGTAIAWRFQTRWFELASGFEAYVWQVRLQGRGAGTLTVRADYASSGGTSQTFDFSQITNVYDTGLHYDAGLMYAIPVFQSTLPFYSIGNCRQMSLLFSGSSSTTTVAPQILGAGTQPSVGSFGLFSIEWLYAQLGLS